MERLTNLSELTIPAAAVVHQIPETICGVRSTQRQKVVTNTAVDSSKDTYNFALHPQIQAEIDVRDCNVVMTVVPKKNKKNFVEADQISVCQAPGLLIWESVSVSIGGREVLTDFKYNNHAMFINLMCGFDSKDKDTLLYGIGYRQDTDGKSKSRDVKLDKPCICRYELMNKRYGPTDRPTDRHTL